MKRTLLLPFFVALMVSCTTDPLPQQEANGQSVQEVQPAGPSPFEGLAMRYDGYYRDSRGRVLYLIRFFPEGRAVLINGTKEIENDLPKFLTRETQGNPTMGLYNEMVEVRGDSLFFMTHPEKGEISYKGTVENASLVRLLRHSHITGKEQIMEYVFHPDPILGPEPVSE